MQVEIQFGGTLRSFKFNEFAHRKITETIFDDIAKGYSVSEHEINSNSIIATFYGGLLGAYYVERKVVDFTFEDVVNWLGDAKDDDVVKVCNTYSDTQRYKDFIAKVSELTKVEEPAKKKVIRKKK